MSRKLIFVVGLIVVLIAILIILSNFASFPKNRKLNDQTKSSESQNIKKYSLEEVAKHNNKKDCWIVIKNKVYNVSNFISIGKHPPQIEMGCGKDATTLFEQRKTEDGKIVGSGTPHSEKAQELLKSYYIGDLK